MKQWTPWALGLLLSVVVSANPALAQGQTLPPVSSPSQPANGPAQGSPNGGRGHGHRLQRLLAQLNLTPEQHDQIRTIIQNSKGQPPRERMQQIRAVLTPAQRAQLRQIRRQQRQQRQQNQQNQQNQQGQPRPNSNNDV